MAISFQCDFVTLSRRSHLLDLCHGMCEVTVCVHILRREIIRPSLTNDK